MPPYIEAISDWAQFILTMAAVIALIKTVSQTAQQPNKTQDARLDALEKRLDKDEERLLAGDTHFKKIDRGLAVMQNSQLAIMDAMINGDNKEELQRQRNNVYEYLTETKALIQ